MRNVSFMFSRLIIPLSVAAVLTLIAGYGLKCFSHDLTSNLMVNLTATFVGSILTVAYVDTVLERRQALRLAGWRSRAAKRLFGLANSFITSIRVALKVSPTAIDGTDQRTQDLRVMRQRMIRLARGVLPDQLSQIPKMNSDDWKHLNTGLIASVEAADRLLHLFGRDFSPRIAELILDIESAAQSVAYHYAVWPDVVGAPEESLPPRKDGSSILPIQRASYDLAIRDSRRLLSLCAELLEGLVDLPSDPN